MENKGRKNGLGYIYKYSLNGTVMYIGQTVDLDRRIKEHSKEIDFAGLTEIEFKGCLERDLNDVEAYFISLYKPILNKVCPKIKANNINEIINHLFPWEKYKKTTESNSIIDNDTLINKQDYITVKEAANIKQVSVSAIYKRIQCGTIPVVYINGQQYVPKKVIEKEANKEIINNTAFKNIDNSNSIILFLLDALETQKPGLKEQYIQLIQRYFNLIIQE